jgi:hypothetical protein
MEAVREGETGRLEELFDRYHGPLYRYFLHLTSDRAAAEDLAQENLFSSSQVSAELPAGDIFPGVALPGGAECVPRPLEARQQ